MAQLEKKLTERGGQFFSGNSLTFADLHVFYFLSEAEFMCPIVVKQYPNLSSLVDRIGSNPNIKNYIETRPLKTKENNIDLQVMRTNSMHSFFVRFWKN